MYEVESSNQGAEPSAPGAVEPLSAPGDGRRRRQVPMIVQFAIASVILLGVGWVGLTFLGMQVSTILRGTIEFGASAGSGCSVGSASATFSTDQTMHFAVHLSRAIATGETVTARLLQDGSELQSVPRAFEQGGDCITGSTPLSGLSPGHYRLEYLVGSELLGAGEFDVGS
jgi:hypothetical protein